VYTCTPLSLVETHGGGGCIFACAHEKGHYGFGILCEPYQIRAYKKELQQVEKDLRKLEIE
jgi:hypothetical protein